MKTSLTLSELAATIEQQAGQKFDYVLPAAKIEMTTCGRATTRARLPETSIALRGTNQPEMGLTGTGHSQLASYVDIPRDYYDRMRVADPVLLATNVNRWLQDESRSKDRRMVRTLNGEARAFLSDSYQRIDNHEVADVTLSELAKMPGLRVVSTAVTESRMYIKAVSSDVVLPVPGSKRGVGDLVEAGVVISNSEVGMGSVSIKPFANFLICLNGMVRDKGLRAAHIGRKADASIEGLLTAGTKRLADELVLRKVRDVLRHAFDLEAFQRFMDQVSGTTQQHITGDVPAAVEALGPTLGLTGGERTLVLRHLIEGGDLSRFGLANAVTRTAEDVDSYDRATQIETLGYKLVDLNARDWSAISAAKPLEMVERVERKARGRLNVTPYEMGSQIIAERHAIAD